MKLYAEMALEYPIVYLATPYTRYKDGPEMAYREAVRITGELLKRGLPVYSPIVHWHPCVPHAGADYADHDYWTAVCAPMLKRSDALLVAMLPGWDKSKGVHVEIKHFEQRCKPIFYTSSIIREWADE